jgi:hypothetical protein
VKHPLWRDLVLGALVLAVLAYAWNFSNLTAPNERTRAYLAIALWDQRTFSVDSSVQRFGHVYDLATFDGHYFTDKAPGSSFLALPVYAALRADRAPEQLTIEQILNAIRSYLMVPAGLLGFLALRWLLRRLAVSEPCLDLVSLGYALGSAALHYATAYYGHVLVATCALLSLLAWARAGALSGQRDNPELPARGSWPAAIGAGAAAGLAGLIEYQAVVLSVLLVVPALGFRWRRALGQGALFVSGALPFAALLLFYNKRAFGSPFELSYHHLVDPSLQALHGSGLAGATKPTLAAFLGLSFSAHRGLFSTSPLLGVGLLALLWPNPRMPTVLRALIALVAVYFLVIVASSSVWFGGWSYGPRLLIPLFAPLAVSAGLFAERYRENALITVPLAAAALFGLICNQLMQVTFSEAPPEVTQPLVQSALPMLKAGLAAPNLGCKFAPLGIQNLRPLVPLLLSVALAIAGSGRLLGLRVLHMVCALGLASVAFAALVYFVPAPEPKDSEGWLRFMRDLSARETSCRVEAPGSRQRGKQRPAPLPVRAGPRR